MQRKRLRRVLATTTAAGLVTFGAGSALAEDAPQVEETAVPESDAGTHAEVDAQPDESSQAEVTVEVNASLVVVTSDKDISNVRVGLADGTVKVFDGLNGYRWEHDLGQDVIWVTAKSGTTVEAWGDLDAQLPADEDTPSEGEAPSEGDTPSDDDTPSSGEGHVDGDARVATVDIDCVVDGTVVVTSDKDISNVRVGLADGSVETFEGLSGLRFERQFDQDVMWVVAKSATTVSVVGAAQVDVDDLPGYLSAEELTAYAEAEVCATSEAETPSDEGTPSDGETPVDEDVPADGESGADTETDVDAETDVEAETDVDAEADVETDAEVTPEESPTATGVLGVTTTRPTAPSVESATTTAAPAGAAELPRTGLPLPGLAALGTAALGAGTMLRRRGR